MKYKIKFLPSALNDLKQIEDYYLYEFGQKSSLKVIENILNTISRLEDFPDSGTLTPDSKLNMSGYRMIICKNRHVAIYKKIFSEIFIYHIADTKTDYPNLF